MSTRQPQRGSPIPAPQSHSQVRGTSGLEPQRPPSLHPHFASRSPSPHTPSVEHFTRGTSPVAPCHSHREVARLCPTPFNAISEYPAHLRLRWPSSPSPPTPFSTPLGWGFSIGPREAPHPTAASSLSPSPRVGWEEEVDLDGGPTFSQAKIHKSRACSILGGVYDQAGGEGWER